MAIDTMKKGSIEMLTLFLLCEEDVYQLENDAALWKALREAK